MKDSGILKNSSSQDPKGEELVRMKQSNRQLSMRHGTNSLRLISSDKENEKWAENESEPLPNESEPKI